jgi:hypothetical protein
LTRVCLDLLKDAPYRFFFSGTQTRTDGAELLLKGIIGPIVFQMSVRDGVDQGYLAKPIFKFYRVTSDSPCLDGDPNKMTREHLFYNPKVNALAGQIANGVIKGLDHSVLILIDEMEQFSKLLPYFRHEVGFAHGGVTKLNRDKYPPTSTAPIPRLLVRRLQRAPAADPGRHLLHRHRHRHPRGEDADLPARREERDRTRPGDGTRHPALRARSVQEDQLQLRGLRRHQRGCRPSPCRSARRDVRRDLRPREVHRPLTMQTTLVGQAIVVQFTFNAHQQWAKCPLCGSVGPQRDKVIEHLNKFHSMPGEDWTLVEAQGKREHALDSFWLAVKQFHPERLKRSTPEQDKKALESMKKAGAMPLEVIQRVEVSINDAIRKKQLEAIDRLQDANKPLPFVKSKKQRQAEKIARKSKSKKGKKK